MVACAVALAAMVAYAVARAGACTVALARAWRGAGRWGEEGGGEGGPGRCMGQRRLFTLRPTL
jgi:hypothetical protein